MCRDASNTLRSLTKFLVSRRCATSYLETGAKSPGYFRFLATSGSESKNLHLLPSNVLDTVFLVGRRDSRPDRRRGVTIDIAVAAEDVRHL